MPTGWSPFRLRAWIMAAYSSSSVKFLSQLAFSVLVVDISMSSKTRAAVRIHSWTRPSIILAVTPGQKISLPRVFKSMSSFPSRAVRGRPLGTSAIVEDHVLVQNSRRALSPVCSSHACSEDGTNREHVLGSHGNSDTRKEAGETHQTQQPTRRALVLATPPLAQLPPPPVCQG